MAWRYRDILPSVARHRKQEGTHGSSAAGPIQIRDGRRFIDRFRAGRPRVPISSGIDTVRAVTKNERMKITEPSVLSPLELADMQAVADAVAAGRLVPPEVARRIRERSEQVRLEILEKHGVVNVGAAIIREMRDAE
jgi:hypothetical protein